MKYNNAFILFYIWFSLSTLLGTIRMLFIIYVIISFRHDFCPASLLYSKYCEPHANILSRMGLFLTLSLMVWKYFKSLPILLGGHLLKWCFNLGRHCLKLYCIKSTYAIACLTRKEWRQMMLLKRSSIMML